MAPNTEPIVDDIRICTIKPEDRQKVLDFLRIYFYPDEPLTGQSDPVHEEFLVSNIEDGTCLMGVQGHEDNVVVALLAGPKGPQEADHLLAAAAKTDSTKWSKIFKFLAGIERDVNVFERYGVQKVLHGQVMGVHSKQRGKRLGVRIVKELMTLAKNLNYEIITADCTGCYSAKIFESLGWECVNTVYYKDYLDDNQCPVFHVAAPHDCCKTFAIRL